MDKETIKLERSIIFIFVLAGLLLICIIIGYLGYDIASWIGANIGEIFLFILILSVIIDPSSLTKGKKSLICFFLTLFFMRFLPGLPILALISFGFCIYFLLISKQKS